MLALSAVEPHGLLVLDMDGVGQNIGSGTERGVGGHEAREESVCLVLDHVLDGDAWLVKGRLSDGVVLLLSLAMAGYIVQQWVITFAWNWNWIRSPALALTLFGEKIREPLGPPTWTMCVLTIPAGVVEPATPVDRLPRAEDTADCAAAKPMRAATTIDLEKYMVMVVILSCSNCVDEITSVEDRRERK